MTRTGTVALAILLLGIAPQGSSGYTTIATVCGRYREGVTSRIWSRIGGTDRRETIGRSGVLLLTGTVDSAGLQIEAWYDSLALYRDAPEGRVVPDTDGLLDGRFRGVLTEDGRYRAVDRPFVPPAVAEVADIQVALDDFLPRLPAGRIAPGAVAKAGDFRFERLQDSSGSHRWRWRLTNERQPVVNDSEVGVAARTIDEIGAMVWDPVRGPLRWTRDITIDVTVRGTGKTPGLRSRIVQTIMVEREDACDD